MNPDSQAATRCGAANDVKITAWRCAPSRRVRAAGEQVGATYLRDVIAGIGRPVVLVGHSYGGMVITEAAAGNDAFAGLVYVAAFAPEQGESALQLSSRFPGSTFGGALVASSAPTGASSSGSGGRCSTSSSSLTGRRPRPG
jgi:pimeloyl-ACP methyl ester carboxylesterase